MKNEIFIMQQGRHVATEELLTLFKFSNDDVYGVKVNDVIVFLGSKVDANREFCNCRGGMYVPLLKV